MESSGKVFEKGLDKAFSSIPLNGEIVKDVVNYKGMVKELEDDEEKEENTEATGTGSSGQFSQPLFSEEGSEKVETNESHESKIRGTIEKVLKEKLGRKPTKSEVDDIHIKIIEKLYQKEKSKKTEPKETISHENSAKKQFAKDLQKDKDFTEFKKNSKYKVDNSEYSFGTPNVSIEDSFIKKRKYSRPGKSDDDFEKIEATEATGSGSVGAYETPAAWAKTTNKKDWRGKSKTQIPGGAFVSIKKKCKSFPYCNQGDIKALNIYKNESVKEAIQSVAKKFNISENTIKAILQYEFEKINK